MGSTTWRLKGLVAFAFVISLLPQSAGAQSELRFPATQFGQAYLLPSQSTEIDALESLIDENRENFEFLSAFSEGHPLTRLSKAVGRVDILRSTSLNDAWVGVCTGTLIAPDHIITAAHCFFTASGRPLRIDQARVRFGFYGDVVPNGDGEDFALALPPAEFDVALDYAILKVQGSPGLQLGIAPISAQRPVAGQELMLVHHPLGQPMRVTRKDCRVVNARTFVESEVRHHCDTLPGSSGAPIFTEINPSFVGIHTRGFRPKTGSNFNAGNPVAAILGKSLLLQNLLEQAVSAAQPDAARVDRVSEPEPTSEVSRPKGQLEGLHARALQFSPNGRYLAVRWGVEGAGQDTLIQVISLKDGRPTATFKSRKSSCHTLVWNDSSSSLAYFSHTSLLVRHLTTGQTAEHPEQVIGCDTGSSNSSGIFEGAHSGHFAIGERDWGEPLRVFKIGSTDVPSFSSQLLRVPQLGNGIDWASLSQTGERIAVVVGGPPGEGVDGVVRVYDVASKTKILEKPLSGGAGSTKVLISGDGKRLIMTTILMQKAETEPYLEQVDVIEVEGAQETTRQFTIPTKGDHFLSIQTEGIAAVNKSGTVLFHRAEGPFISATGLSADDGFRIAVPTTTEGPRYETKFAISADSHYVAASWSGGQIYILDGRRKQVSMTIDAVDTLRGIDPQLELHADQ